ncbi:Phosphatidylinositol-4-phosphate 5-kinase, core [Kalmanozyma brasiliensis GHG001]|uniref:1-phosphatidylinositol-4-phosphate 5-kinase n=1 Tax=Kalmanozyma brasiliensis (strain GHG001) TaxID=1365824 RepID=V5EZ10_KALBG|nr:Phosphatidylinositol-4-phosphate 5-kinase, core [Kalmanozyma brasiliensis GHG001]EST08039.1 Phosphatidylinositol-4-phosphate 5-kinase, core [Kalmanozyma brasiliensis GHG001]
MLIHSSEADTLNSIRLALEHDEQQIRVNDSTGEVYDITISRSNPYASPFVSPSATVNDAAHDASLSGANGHTSTSSSAGHRILRLPQLVSKRAHGNHHPVQQPATVESPGPVEKQLPDIQELSPGRTSQQSAVSSHRSGGASPALVEPIARQDAASKSQSSFTAPTRHHPFLSELPPSPPLEADYVSGHDSRNGLMSHVANGSPAHVPTYPGNGAVPSSSKALEQVAAPAPAPISLPSKPPVARRANTSDAATLMGAGAPVAQSPVDEPTSINGADVNAASLPQKQQQAASSSAYCPPAKLKERRNASTASTASTAYRTASEVGDDDASVPQQRMASNGSASSHLTSGYEGTPATPTIRLTHDASPYHHDAQKGAEAGSSLLAVGSHANGDQPVPPNGIPPRQHMSRRNTTGSAMQGRRSQSAGSTTQSVRRSSRDRESTSPYPGQPWLADALNSPTAEGSTHALRTGDAAFDEEAAKHAEQLRRDRRYKEQKARDAAAEGSSGDKDHTAIGAAAGTDGVVGALKRSKTGRDWLNVNAKDKERTDRVRERDEDAVPKVLVGNLIGEGHANYVLMYNMLTGIRIGVSRCQAKMKRSLCDADFTAKHKFTFDIIGRELTPHAKYDFKFKDYAPWVFRELREHFHLDAADYLLSLTSKYILSELGSPGKSGSFFYFSRDYRFIIKTIRHSEHKFLLRILKDYHEHVKANPHTLLSRFYGLHRVKLPHGRKIHFVIMNNLFPPHRDIHETYDLKGSSIGRDYPEEKAAAKSGAVLKDLNWLRRGREIELGPEKRALFEAQLRSDVALMQRLNIMDYSLLIGLHDMRRGNIDNLRQDNLRVFQPETKELKRQPTQVKKPGNEQDASALRQAVRRSDPKALNSQQVTKLPDRDVSERRHFLFYQDEGGFRSTDEHNQPGHMIYYLGVIDLFTPYTSIKRGETWWKGLRQNRHMISSVPPKEYGQRFFDFLCSVVTGGDKSRRPKMWGFTEKDLAKAKAQEKANGKAQVEGDAQTEKAPEMVQQQ